MKLTHQPLLLDLVYNPKSKTRNECLAMLSSTKIDEFKQYLENQLTTQGKKFLVLGETHSSFNHGLTALLTALRDIKEFNSTIILVTEALPQIRANGKNQSYSIEQLRSCLDDESVLKIMEELLELGVQVYGAENEYTDFIHFPKAASKEELYQRLVATGLFSSERLASLKDDVDNPYVVLKDLELFAAMMFTSMNERLVRGNEAFTECLVQVTHECKDENVLGIFEGGSQHVPAASRNETVFEPGIAARIPTEYKKISGAEAKAAACYIARPTDRPADSYTPATEEGVTYAAISPVFLAPMPPELLLHQQMMFGRKQEVVKEKKKKQQNPSTASLPCCVIL